MPRTFPVIRRWLPAVVVALYGGLWAPAQADEPQTRPVAEQNAGTITEATVRQWVRELDADRFEVRQRAQDELVKAGFAPERARMVIEPLLEAANQGSLEVAMRALNILKELYDSSAVATREAAREALEKLAQSDNKGLAAKAAAIVRPNPEVTHVPGLPGGRVILNGGGQLNILGGFAGQQEFKIVNGVGQRTIHTKENGRTIAIKEDTQNGINLTVTERVDGKDKTKAYAAKDAAELKQKHPEAWQLYEKYTAGKPMGNMLGGMFVFGGGINVPLPPPPAQDVPQPPAVDRRNAAEKIEALKDQLKTSELLVQRMRELVAAGHQVPQRTLNEELGRIEALRKQMIEAEKALAQ